eukprot:jgi/Botrbrau1/20146/Bobra.0173s0048.1
MGIGDTSSMASRNLALNTQENLICEIMAVFCKVLSTGFNVRVELGQLFGRVAIDRTSQWLGNVGEFLAMDIFIWESAGEVCKAQAGEAAAVACSVEYPFQLRWLAPQCCGDYKDAARVGHSLCLQLLGEVGEFLPLDSPDWALAGEARKAQAWEAAAVASSADRAPPLKWPFRAGWPTSSGAVAPWHLPDSFCWWHCLGTADRTAFEHFILEHEYELYYHAVRRRRRRRRITSTQPKGPDEMQTDKPTVYENLIKIILCYNTDNHTNNWIMKNGQVTAAETRSSTTACLVALLEAGCRSQWLCAIAAAEGQKDRLSLAARAECPCDIRMPYIAAHRFTVHCCSLLAVVKAVYEEGTNSVTSRPFVDFIAGVRWYHRDEFEAVPIKYSRRKLSTWTLFPIREAVASEGHLECIEKLLRWFGDKTWLPYILYTATQSGHLNCLQSIERWRPQPVDWQTAAQGAVWGGHLECLKFALEKGAGVECGPLCDAAAGRNLVDSGWTWTGMEAEAAAEAGDSEVLVFWLRHVQPEIPSLCLWADVRPSSLFLSQETQANLEPDMCSADTLSMAQVAQLGAITPFLLDLDQIHRAVEQQRKDFGLGSYTNPGSAFYQCCRDYKEATRAGHQYCLQRLGKVGEFLALDIFDWESAGEARKAQAGEAAAVACSGDHPSQLICLEPQCCGDYKDAARVGHRRCLQLFGKVGEFLPLDSPDWASAGEARKAQAWEAAAVACSADRAPLLRWLFRAGWPTSSGTIAPWHLPDSFCWWHCLRTADRTAFEHFILEYEYELYYYAVRSSNTACLEALLEAGCRSPWLCAIAAAEGKKDHLRLAVRAGCPCDIRVLDIAARSGRLEVLKFVYEEGTDSVTSRRFVDFMAGVRWYLRDQFEASLVKYFERKGRRLTLFPILEAVASKGHLECLEKLLRWFGSKNWLPYLLYTAAQSGHLNCLQSIERWRPQPVDWQTAAQGAARGGQLACLKFALEKGAGVECGPLCAAAAGRNLVESGWTWTGMEVGNSEVLAVCVRHAQPWGHRDWYWAMCGAMKGKSLKCVLLLYERGYERHRSHDPRHHPALLAVHHGNVACLRLAVQCSGQPDPELLETAIAARSGENMLRWVWEMGGRINKGTALEAIRTSQVGALRFAFQVGVPFHMDMIWAAIEANSLECLRCVCEQVRTVGLPQGYDEPAPGYWRVPRNLDPAIVQYLANYVNDRLSRPIMVWAAERYAARARDVKGGHLHDKDGRFWRIVLLLARWFGREPLPAPLCELVAVRRERAAALAGVFYKAGKLTLEETPSPSLPLWRAMADLPFDLREQIAFQAHLVAPLHKTACCLTSEWGPAARIQPLPA